MLKGKKIIIGITGSIAAYKTPILIRSLIKEGAEVKIVATKNALEFVTKMTLETLSKNKLYYDVFDKDNDYATEHISLAEWGDVLLVAPASANIIGKYANGIADDVLSTLLLAFTKKVFIAPAMNTGMYNSFPVQKNIKYLESNGISFMAPAYGDLACGTVGDGRMEEPEKIVGALLEYVNRGQDLKNRKILITAGPTQESIDPVRFITNHSSGLMGFEMARICAERGAHVTLIAGPVNLSIAMPTVNRINVVTANQMRTVCLEHFEHNDITIMAAAVADYMSEDISAKKIKKQPDKISIKLVKTPDILEELGKKKRNDQMLVGFALETDNELNNAKLKVKNKNLDFIVLNSLRDKGAGFKHLTNKITIINKHFALKVFDLKPKSKVAVDIVNEIVATYKK